MIPLNEALNHYVPIVWPRRLGTSDVPSRGAGQANANEAGGTTLTHPL